MQETLAEFIKLAATNPNYEVTPYTVSRPLSDKELYGPLGCEWWGKVRVPGSNACIPKGDLQQQKASTEAVKESTASAIAAAE